MKKMKIMAVALLISLLLPGSLAFADSGEIWKLIDEQGNVLTSIAAAVDVGDQYIASDNTLYEVTALNEAEMTATVQNMGEEPMLSLAISPVAQQTGNKKIGVYVTHSDESYEEGDGTSSTEDGWAGIHDVATALQQNLESYGIEVVFDHTPHLPHDSGAYRRSRATAVQLAEQGVSALLDIHRDGIPDAGEYVTEVDGEKTTMVRLLVGRSNPNSAANKEFAKKLKSAADSVYPGLVKDIFIGKGNYNQEIMPQSILLEFGTHTSDKNQVAKSTVYMADVINMVLFGGGKSGGEEKNESSKGGAGAGGSTAVPSPGVNGAQQDVEVTPQSQSTGGGSGAATGIAWLIGIAVVGVIGFAVISGGGFSGLGNRLKRFSSELTGGAVGKKPDDDDY